MTDRSTLLASNRSATVELQPGQLLVCDHRAGLRLQVLAGGLWLTEEGSLADRFGAAGEWLRVEGRGRAVAEALSPARVRVVAPGRGVQRGADVGRRLLVALTRTPAFALALLVGLGLPEMLARVFQQSLLA